MFTLIAGIFGIIGGTLGTLKFFDITPKTIRDFFFLSLDKRRQNKEERRQNKEELITKIKNDSNVRDYYKIQLIVGLFILTILFMFWVAIIFILSDSDLASKLGLASTPLLEWYFYFITAIIILLFIGALRLNNIFKKALNPQNDF